MRPDRTRFLVLFIIGLLGAAPVATAAEPRPNLLIVMTDEHNFRTLGCYRALLPPDQAFMWGPAVVETPRIDWLAKRGAICTSFYATTPVCSPSRSSFVSGRYPQNTPVVTNNIPLDGRIVTFAEVLRRQGYATGYAGKWHLDGSGKPQWAPKRKFGFEDNRYMFNRGHWKQLQDTPAGPRVAARDNQGSPSYSIEGADRRSFTTDFLTDKTIEFIQAHRDEPYCYMLSLPDPHGPDTVRAPYDTMFDKQTYSRPRSAGKAAAGLPSWGTKDKKAGFDMSRYYGMVKCIDDNVGRILDTLRATGQIDRTVVVFTADHGDLRGEHHRHNKGVPYEASALVPFIVYGLQKIKPGTVVREALGSADFQPTILRLMGVELSGREEGRDVSALLTGRRPNDWVDVTFLRGTSSKARGGRSWIAAVSDRYKLVYSPRDKPWLFDLQKDPDELINALDRPEHRETVRKLSVALVNYAKRTNDSYVQAPRIQSDLRWAIGSAAAYRAPDGLLPEPAPAPGTKGKRRG